MTKQVHLALPTPQIAATIHQLLSSAPLFSQSFPATRKPSRGNLTSRAKFTFSNAAEWRGSQCLGVETALARWGIGDAAALGRRGRGEAVRSARFGQSKGEGDVLRFDADWVQEPEVEGKRVVVKGYPYGMGVDRFKEMIEEKRGAAVIESGLEEGPDAIVKLPSDRKRTAIFAMTFKTVADATRAARRLNMTRHRPPGAPEVTIRAEVVW